MTWLLTPLILMSVLLDRLKGRGVAGVGARGGGRRSGEGGREGRGEHVTGEGTWGGEREGRERGESDLV